MVDCLPSVQPQLPFSKHTPWLAGQEMLQFSGGISTHWSPVSWYPTLHTQLKSPCKYGGLNSSYPTPKLLYLKVVPRHLHKRCWLLCKCEWGIHFRPSTGCHRYSNPCHICKCSFPACWCRQIQGGRRDVVQLAGRIRRCPSTCTFAQLRSVILLGFQKINETWKTHTFIYQFVAIMTTAAVSSRLVGTNRVCDMVAVTQVTLIDILAPSTVTDKSSFALALVASWNQIFEHSKFSDWIPVERTSVRP